MITLSFIQISNHNKSDNIEVTLGVLGDCKNKFMNLIEKGEQYYTDTV